MLKMEVYLSNQRILWTCIGLFCKKLKLDLMCIQCIMTNLSVKAAKQQIFSSKRVGNLFAKPIGTSAGKKIRRY